MRPIRTKIVGVTHRNSDGSSRQKILKRMQEEYYEGDLLYLEAEPENPYDENAIKVMNAEDEQIGYLSRDLAKTLAKRMDNGEEFSVELLEITGGYDGFALGCNIEIEAIIKRENDKDRDEKHSDIANVVNIVKDDDFVDNVVIDEKINNEVIKKKNKSFFIYVLLFMIIFAVCSPIVAIGRKFYIIFSLVIFFIMKYELDK